MKLPVIRLLTDPDEIFLYKCDINELFNPNPRDHQRFYYESRFTRMIKSIQRNMTEGNFLDLGCAQANFTISLAEKGYYAIGVDINKSFIKYAKLKIERGSENLDFIVGSAEHLPIRCECFKGVILGELLEHLSKPKNVLHEVKRILQHDSYLFISTPNGERLGLGNGMTYTDIKNIPMTQLKEKEFRPDAHVFEFTANELLFLLLNTNFKIIEFRYVAFLFPITFVLTKIPLPTYILRKIEETLLNLPLIKKKLSRNIVCTAKLVFPNDEAL